MSGTKADELRALLRERACTVSELVRLTGATKRHVLATLRAGVEADEIERIELVRGGPLYRTEPADSWCSVWFECSWCGRAIDLSQEIELRELLRLPLQLGDHSIRKYRLVGYCGRCLPGETGE